MNTPAHLLIGAALFSRRNNRPATLGAILGAVAPDLSLYIMAGVSMFVLGIAPERVFNELYFSDAWQLVFAVDNSIPLWGAVLVLGLWRKWTFVWALAAAALVHIGLDLPLHHDDGRAHFWPFSSWVFESPVSYWDRNHHSLWFLPLGAVLAAAALFSLLRRFTNWWIRV
ncbi:MAG: cobalamin biosynthesis protein CobQ, partial [Pseudomonadota bacterium]